MRAVILYALLLVGALTATYLNWTAVESKQLETGEVTVYTASEGEVSTIAYTSKMSDVTVTRKSDAKGDYVQVHMVKRTEVTPEVAPEDTDAPAATDAPATTDAPAAAPDAPVIETDTRTFTGNRNAVGLLKNYEPLVALRTLDPSMMSASLGFDEPAGTITVTKKNGEVELVLGGKSYGSKHVYTQVGDKLFLLRETGIKPLQGDARRLMDRDLQPLRAPLVDRIQLKAGAIEKTFVHHNRADPKAAYWAQGEASERDDAAATLVDKLLGLKAKADPPEDLPEPGEPLLAFSANGDEGPWRVEVFAGSDDRAVVRSEHLRSTVYVAKDAVDEILADLATL